MNRSEEERYLTKARTREGECATKKGGRRERLSPQDNMTKLVDVLDAYRSQTSEGADLTLPFSNSVFI